MNKYVLILHDQYESFKEYLAVNDGEKDRNKGRENNKTTDNINDSSLNIKNEESTAFYNNIKFQNKQNNSMQENTAKNKHSSKSTLSRETSYYSANASSNQKVRKEEIKKQRGRGHTEWIKQGDKKFEGKDVDSYLHNIIMTLEAQ